MVFQLHIGVLAFPFGTHASPLLTLAQRLAAAAPGTIFSFFNSADSNKSISSARVSETFANIQIYDIWDGTPEGFSGSHFEAIALFLKASPGNFEKAMEEAESETGLKISCLITDAFCWFASDMAENRGVPWVPFWTAASCSLSAHLYTDKIQNTLGSADPEEDQTVTFIPGLSNVHITDLPPEIFIDKNPTPLALTIYNMVTKLPKSTAIVLNSFEEIDPIITKDLKSKFNNFLNVGPSILSSPIPPTTNPNDPHNCLNWLQTQKNPNSVIYISFGTVISPPPNEIAELAKALESCKFPFLWSIKGHALKTLPQGFENRTKNWGKIVPWAPQLEILRQNCVGVFVTHCGWNSVVESICGGVPMICRPFFGDQRINGRMVEDVWRVGVRVKNGVFGEDDTVKSLKCLMMSEKGEEMRENVGKMREKAVEAVKLEGSSNKNFEKLLEIISAPKGN